jgi:hypothetical protein
MVMTKSPKPSCLRTTTLSLLFFLIVVPLLAQAPAGGRGGRRSGPGTGEPFEFVPWHYLGKGNPLVPVPLALYWLPASPDEVEQSPLQTSKVLFEDTALCLQFEIVLPDDEATINKFNAAGKLPSVLLVDAQGNVVRRVEGSRGKLNVASVERMVGDELNVRGGAMYARITEAKKRVASGDKEGAIDLYRKVWDERCLFPLIGGEAQHALKDLGVTVVEPPPQIPIDPNLAPPKLNPEKPKAKPPGEH